MTAMAADPRHLVTHTVAGMHAALDAVAETPLWSMGPGETATTLVEVTRLAARVAELELRVAAHADAVGAAQTSGATSTGSWWAVETRQTRPRAHRRTALARALDDRWQRVRAALAAGAMLAEQAEVIVAALDELPDDVEAWVVAAAEEALVGFAADHDAKALRILGRRVLGLVAPEVAEAHEARLLAEEDRRAEAAMRFTMSDDGHGSVRGRFTLPKLHGEMLRKALLALAAPKRQHASTGDGDGATSATAADQAAESTESASSDTGEDSGEDSGNSDEADRDGKRVPMAERMGRAFAEYIERYPLDRTPHAGGVAATVVVTMTLDQLMDRLHGRLTDTAVAGGATPGRTEPAEPCPTDGPAPGYGAAMVDTGEVISAAAARRLACEAGILPAVLGGKSQVLDLGRRRRLHTEPQRIAMGIRDRGCTAQGCDWPPGLCHAHHDVEWAQGGATSVDKGRLLCPHHHARAHDPAYAMTRLPGGRVSFHRRT